MVKVYQYKGCDTCRKAVKFLDEKGVKYTAIPIREQPPTRNEIMQMVAAYEGELQKLFNTSGGAYRSLNLKNRMRLLTEGEKMDLLLQNGSLIKRPFVVGDGVALVGFKPEAWEAAFA